jgi:hypothetical protein
MLRPGYDRSVGRCLPCDKRAFTATSDSRPLLHAAVPPRPRLSPGVKIAGFSVISVRPVVAVEPTSAMRPIHPVTSSRSNARL